MALEAGTQEERVAGRVWTVRLDPYGRPSAGAVRLSCSRPDCTDQRFPGGAAEGRRAAVGHVNAHLARIREGGGPRGEAWCACRAAECAWHTTEPVAGRRGGGRQAAGATRCGGSVVLTLYADRAGRLWRIAETCARCAAATPGIRILDTAPPPARPARPDTERQFMAGAAGAAGAAGDGRATVPRARATSTGQAPRRAGRWGKIAQRPVPPDLRPDILREELFELGDEFRAYQKRPEPDLALLADLHERKARAFRLWADVTGDDSLREEADRAEKAVEITREMHENRMGGLVGDPENGPVVQRLLTRIQAMHARAVLDYVAAHSPYPEAGVRLAVFMIILRSARAGVGNVTGQEFSGWLQGDAEPVLERLVEADWLRLPGTIAEAMASRPESPTAVTVPALLPGEPLPFAFGKTNRARISGWAQKVVGDRKIRKKKLPAAARLLALYTAAHARPDGSLGRAGERGLDLESVTAFCALSAEGVAEHAGRLTAVDWLAEADITDGRLRGRLAERVLPLGAMW